MSTATVNLLPLAPKGASSLPSLTQSLHSLDYSRSVIKPLVAPHQSLMLNPGALARASLAESLVRNPLLTMSYNQGQRQLKQQLQQQLLNLQHRAPVPAFKALPPKSKQQDIIGMGICVPMTAPRPSKLAPSEATRRMCLIGNPLRAPPRLCKSICKRSVPTSTDASSNKRRKVVTPPPGSPTAKKTLTSEELEFVQAAQCLQDIHSANNSLCAPPSPVSPLKTTVSPLTSKALRAPPSLGL